jgi:hypothetical protein
MVSLFGKFSDGGVGVVNMPAITLSWADEEFRTHRPAAQYNSCDRSAASA